VLQSVERETTYGDVFFVDTVGEDNLCTTRPIKSPHRRRVLKPRGATEARLARRVGAHANGVRLAVVETVTRERQHDRVTPRWDLRPDKEDPGGRNE
jgi:hypothetical protein